MTHPEYCGILNIEKVPGMSSHEVVARVRRLVQMKRVGHAGTLDPAACGVLIVCLGRATKLSDYIADGPKTYRAEILFGIVTDSEDAEGDIIAHQAADHLDEARITAVFPAFIGDLQQRPPAHSAVWIGGVRAYHLARRGEEVNLPLRPVTIYSITPVRFQPGTHPRLLVDVSCAKGTYIRSLARDLGEAVGTGACLSFLARTRTGDFTIEEAWTLEEVLEALEAGRFHEVLQSPASALTHLPRLELEHGDGYLYGAPVPVSAAPGTYRVYQHDVLLGLGKVTDGALRAAVHLPPA